MSQNAAYHMLISLQISPKKTCLVINGVAIDKEGFHRLVTNYVNLLKKSGAKPGDSILITINISINFYAMAVATMAIGGAIVIINTTIGWKRIDHCVKLASPAVWVFEKTSWLKYIHFLIPSLRGVSIRVSLDDSDGRGTDQPLMRPEDVTVTDNALVTFTTGSTGMPKLLLRKHEFVMNQSKGLSIAFKAIMHNQEEKDSTIMTNLNVFGLHFLLVGSTGMIHSNIRKFDCDELLQLLRTHKSKPTVIMGSPYFLNKIAVHCSQMKQPLPADYVAVGGAPTFRKILRSFKGLIPDECCFTVYGCTEIEPISFVSAKERLEVEDTNSDGHCVGRPAFKDSVKVIRILTDKESASESKMLEDYEIGIGNTGEVVVTGWHVNIYQVTRTRILTDKDGKLWLRTEDAGYLDNEGRVWLVGRVKWRVDCDDKCYWSISVEQKVLDRCSLITFAAYLPHQGKACLVLEAPQGLPPVEKKGILSMLRQNGIPVDVFKVLQSVPKDWRHNSKPNTALLFNQDHQWTIIVIVIVVVMVTCLLYVMY